MNIEPKPLTEFPNPVFTVGIDYGFAQDDCDYIDCYEFSIDDNYPAIVVFTDENSAETFCKDANDRIRTECPLVVVKETLAESYRTFYNLLSRSWRNEPNETLLVWMSPTSLMMPRNEATLHYAEAVLAWLHKQMPPDERYPELTSLWGNQSSSCDEDNG